MTMTLNVDGRSERIFMKSGKVAEYEIECVEVISRKGAKSYKKKY